MNPSPFYLTKLYQPKQYKAAGLTAGNGWETIWPIWLAHKINQVAGLNKSALFIGGE